MIWKIFMVVSWMYIIFGVLGIFRFNNLYSRLLTSSKIDTVAAIAMLIALTIYSGFSAYTVKLLLLLFFLILTNPISSHIIVRSAYLNGMPINEKEDKQWKWR
ncbi:MAG TPA: monovalent cation/H(+) antiporter subunit G [Clostridia bacterium]|nr:monovalent cation/H(+) antiporter subunit G [Clostridia bacterium]